MVDISCRADGSASLAERAQVLPPHATCAVLADVCGDGTSHLLAALDAEVRLFRPAEASGELECHARFRVHARARSLSLCDRPPADSRPAAAGPLLLVGTVDSAVLALDPSLSSAAVARALMAARPGESVVLGGLHWPAAGSGDGARGGGEVAGRGASSGAAYAVARNSSVVVVRAGGGDALTELSGGVPAVAPSADAPAERSGAVLTELHLGEAITGLFLRAAGPPHVCSGVEADAQELVVCTASGLVVVVRSGSGESGCSAASPDFKPRADVGQMCSSLRCQLAVCAAGRFALAPRPPAATEAHQPAPAGAPVEGAGCSPHARSGEASGNWCLAYVAAGTNELFLTHAALTPAPGVTSLLELLRAEQQVVCARALRR